MPLFFFDVDDGERVIRDEAGIVFDSDVSIELEAMEILKNLVHLKMPVGRRIMTVLVRSADDVLVYRGLMTVSGKRYK